MGRFAPQVAGGETSGGPSNGFGATEVGTKFGNFGTGNYRLITVDETFNVPTDADGNRFPIRVRGWGAGGGAYSNQGGGGAGGAFGLKVIHTPDASYTVTVGQGGLGGLGTNNGIAGGTTSFGTELSLTGGAGGKSQSYGAALGGTSTGGDINHSGGSGGPANGGGGGAGSLFGPGGNGGGGNSNPYYPAPKTGGSGGGCNGDGHGAAGLSGRPGAKVASEGIHAALFDEPSVDFLGTGPGGGSISTAGAGHGANGGGGGIAMGSYQAGGNGGFPGGGGGTGLTASGGNGANGLVIVEW